MYLEAHISNEPELQMNAACQVWFYEAWREGNHINNTDNYNLLKLPRPKHQRGFNHLRKYICKYRDKQKAEIHTS